MKKYFFLIIFFAPPLFAEEIIFSKAINVTLNNSHVFHHLDASGRKSIDTNHDTVAITWEDNRSGIPQTYVAFKQFTHKDFTHTQQLSNAKTEAYEPAVVTINKQQFLFAWEQDQHVWASYGNNQQLTNPVLLDKHPSSQVSLATTPDGKIYACWIQLVKPHRQLVVSELKLADKQIHIGQAVIVDQHSTPRRQSYPSITATENGIAIGWEDREHGHTRIYTSYSADGKHFSKKQVLNDFKRPPNAKYGRGTGATRVALSSDNKNTVVASWMDKRDFLGGYDIYAAISTDAGKNYSTDEIVQDMLGENQPQWHPSVAINKNGRIYVAWDDPRDDSPDVWLSHRLKNEWSEDQLVDPASGEGNQSNPSITFDGLGRLHLVWIEQQAKGTMLRYAHQQ